MSFNPLAPVFLPRYQSSSEPHVSFCNSTTMSLSLAQLICGMPPQIIRSHTLSINQHITDGSFLLPLLQPTNQSKPDAAVRQPTPRSSALLPSSLQHQAICLQAIHKTIWDHPKPKQTILQTPISSPHPTRRKLVQLRCRNSHQEFANAKNCLAMKHQFTHPYHYGDPFPILFLI